MQTILYAYHGNLYVNLTNRCPCRCTFCLRQTKDEMDGSGSLWLEHEPAADEVKAELDGQNLSKYGELVFCGFGEPTERLDAIVEITKYVKAKNPTVPVRVNTNGLSDLINGRDTAADFAGIDAVSISLNTPDPDEYLRLTRSKFGTGSFEAMLRFAGNVKKYVPKVTLSTVSTTITPQEEARCAAICRELGVTYRIRPFE